MSSNYDNPTPNLNGWYCDGSNEQNNPKLCEVVTEFTILIKSVSLRSGVFGNVHHKIFLGHDGSVYLKEVLVTVSKDEILNQSTSRNFYEFAEKFPEDAKIIRDYVNRNILTIPGLDKRHDL